jgi:hypothetical protein
LNLERSEAGVDGLHPALLPVEDVRPVQRRLAELV